MQIAMQYKTGAGRSLGETGDETAFVDLVMTP